MMLRLLAVSSLLVLSGCDYTEVVREIGYKGKARVNPWLAAERYCGKTGLKARSMLSWTAPDWQDSVWFLPASTLGNRSFIGQVEDWVDDGGHLVLLVGHADSESNDWFDRAPEPQLDEALLEMLDDVGIDFHEDEEAKAGKVQMDGESFEIEAESDCAVAANDGKPGVFASVASGEGRVTVVTDARIFRNRWIGDKDHAALLDKLLRVTDFEGGVVFMRGSELSLWDLLGKHLWPVLFGLAVLVALWLWKNLTRFGPVESSAESAALRGFDHHLEALGDFQWRIDRAAGLLSPLRAQILERGQRLAARSGRRDDDFFQFLSDRAELPRERVFRALAEAAPPDSAVLTRIAADLQHLLRVLH